MKLDGVFKINKVTYLFNPNDIEAKVSKKWHFEFKVLYLGSFESRFVVILRRSYRAE